MNIVLAFMLGLNRAISSYEAKPCEICVRRLEDSWTGRVPAWLARRSRFEGMVLTFTERSQRLENLLPPCSAIEAFFEEIVKRSLADKKRRGCLLVNSGMELSPHDPEFRRVVADVLERVETFFLRLVIAGQEDGTVTTAQPAADLACTLLAAFLGIRVLARTRPEPRLLRGAVRPVLAMLRS
jgi:TetR/AcrR family transcriptional regulator, transcriptional repressor for nem operon